MAYPISQTKRLPDFGNNSDPDGDGVPASLDLDADNDGIPDAIEAPGGDFTVDTDGDGIPDYVDLDSDNDGIADVIEGALIFRDEDRDGVIDAFTDADGDGLDDRIDANMLAIDTDGDGIADFRDVDSDGDGLSDASETEIGAFDSDGDGVIDGTTDTDADGWLDVVDGLVNNTQQVGAVLTDTDNNGVPNFRSLDSDGDGFNDDVENGDFDGNGIMDNLENQNNGELETATRGSGGAMGWEVLGFGLLFGWIAWRQRQRMPSSLALLVAASVVLPGLMSTPPAYANTDCHQQSLGDPDTFQKCWYVQAGLNLTHVDPENTVNGFSSTDDDSDGWKVSVGWHFKRRWFAELAYADLGEAGLSNVNPAIEALVPNAEIDYQTSSLMVGYWLREPESQWNAFLKAGIGNIRNDANDRRIGFEKQTEVQAVFGLGVQYQTLSNGWFYRGEFDSYDRDAWLIGFSVGRYFEPRGR